MKNYKDGWNKMLQLLGMIGIVLTFGLVFMACATAPNKISYDESLSPDDVALITVFAVRVIKFNNNDVNWYNEVHNGRQTDVEVSIPSGESELVLSAHDTKDVFGAYLYNGGAFLLKYNFNKGHHYHIQAYNINYKREMMLRIIDETTKNREKLTITQIEQ